MWSTEAIDKSFSDGEFTDLPVNVKRKLVRMMARISEASYRRGFQHGVEIGDARTFDPFTFRYHRSLDKSPHCMDPGGFTSIKRLFIENSRLREIGFADAGVDNAYKGAR